MMGLVRGMKYTSSLRSLSALTVVIGKYVQSIQFWGISAVAVWQTLSTKSISMLETRPLFLESTRSKLNRSSPIERSSVSSNET